MYCPNAADLKAILAQLRLDLFRPGDMTDQSREICSLAAQHSPLRRVWGEITPIRFIQPRQAGAQPSSYVLEVDTAWAGVKTINPALSWFGSGRFKPRRGDGLSIGEYHFPSKGAALEITRFVKNVCASDDKRRVLRLLEEDEEQFLGEVLMLHPAYGGRDMRNFRTFLKCDPTYGWVSYWVEWWLPELQKTLVDTFSYKNAINEGYPHPSALLRHIMRHEIGLAVTATLREQIAREGGICEISGLAVGGDSGREFDLDHDAFTGRSFEDWWVVRVPVVVQRYLRGGGETRETMLLSDMILEDAQVPWDHAVWSYERDHGRRWFKDRKFAKALIDDHNEWCGRLRILSRHVHQQLDRDGLRRRGR